MRLGLFGARADDRGLGRLTKDFFDHMRPDRTMVIDMGSHAHGFSQHLDRYPGATVVPFNGGHIAPDTMREFFTGLDVTIMYETAYDHRAYTVARETGCRTVLYSMPEFHRHATERHLPRPDTFWVPTTWRLDTFPPGTLVMPAPVATSRAPVASPPGRFLRALHVAGHPTSGDRNGTAALDRALRSTAAPLSVRVTSQGRLSPLFSRLPATRVDVGTPTDHWSLYSDADLLVMPRRYGGLCLPVQEAMAAGLGVVMTDCDPNPATWPICPVRSRPGRTLRTPGGPVVLHDPDTGDLAAILDRLSGDRAEVEHLQARARSWAVANSWEALAPRWRAALGDAASTPVPVQSSRPRTRLSQRRA